MLLQSQKPLVEAAKLKAGGFITVSPSFFDMSLLNLTVYKVSPFPQVKAINTQARGWGSSKGWETLNRIYLQLNKTNKLPKNCLLVTIFPSKYQKEHPVTSQVESDLLPKPFNVAPLSPLATLSLILERMLVAAKSFLGWHRRGLGQGDRGQPYHSLGSCSLIYKIAVLFQWMKWTQSRAYILDKICLEEFLLNLSPPYVPESVWTLCWASKGHNHIFILAAPPLPLSLLFIICICIGPCHL